MRRILVAIPVLLLMMASCGGRQAGLSGDEAAADSLPATDSATLDSLAEAIGDIPMPKAADELFDDFIFNFAANRKLQMERIAFPLVMMTGEKQEHVQKSHWKMEYFFMRQGYYTLLFDSEREMDIVKDTSVHHAVVEKIFLEDQRVQQYVFDRLRGTWMLTSVRTVSFSQALNSTFLPFYRQFASDKDFQQRHLAETVHFTGPDPDDDFSQMEGIITPDTWEAFAPQLPSGMIYNIIYGEPKAEGNSKVFVLRGIANGLELEMTFKRRGGDWKLTKLST